MNAIDRAIADIQRDAAIAGARRARIAADPRIIRLKAMREAMNAPASSALDIFERMANGTLARRHRIAALVRVRIAQLDFNGTSSAAARVNLCDAALTRRQHWNTVTVSPEFVALEFVTEPSARPAETGKDTNQIGHRSAA